MKLHQSRVLSQMPKFAIAHTESGLMRLANDNFLIWKICEYFQPKSILEIGFFAGQTFGLILEAAPHCQKLVSVDIDYVHRPIFQQVFQDEPRIQQIEFIETDSKNLKLEGTFDFIHIDGDHSYEYALNDLNKSLTWAHEDTILCMDDYSTTAGVMQVVKEELLGKNDFVPFLSGDQEMFFHHRSHSADHFLDQWIQESARNFIYFSNYNFHGFTVLRAQTPKIFEENSSMFYQALQFYNL